jgi:parvulin-like peptidyl-prolyl isomerase
LPTVDASRSIRSLILAAALGLVLSACASGNTPAALVNGQDVTDLDVAATAGVFRSISEVQTVPCGTVDGETDTQDAACNRLSLGLLIAYRLSDSYAAEHGITVPDAAVNDAVSRFESTYGQQPMRDQLTANDVTQEDFLTVVHSSLVQQEVAKALALESLGEDGLRKAYEDNLGDYTVIQVDHILVKTKAEAQKVYEQVTAPGATRDDFLSLAKQVSIDPTAAQNSGSLGSAYAATYDQDFATAALALEPGETSKPVKTQFGWHVIHMVDKEVTPFEQVRDQLLQQQAAQAFSLWMQQQDDEGAIEVNPTYGRYDRDQLAVLRISSTDVSATPTVSPTPVNAPTG